MKGILGKQLSKGLWACKLALKYTFLTVNIAGRREQHLFCGGNAGLGIFFSRSIGLSPLRSAFHKLSRHRKNYEA